jgi:hypothetical protein
MKRILQMLDRYARAQNAHAFGEGEPKKERVTATNLLQKRLC